MRMAARVREVISSRKTEFSPLEITTQLGLKRGRPVRNVLTDMLHRGEVERTGHGRYRFLGFSPRWFDRATVKPRIYRAIHVKKSFRAKELAPLCDARVHSIHRVLLELFRSGDLDRVNLEENGKVKQEFVYMVKHPDRFYLKYCAKKATEQPKGGN